MLEGGSFFFWTHGTLVQMSVSVQFAYILIQEEYVTRIAQMIQSLRAVAGERSYSYF